MSVLADIDQELVNVSMQTLQTLLSSDTALIEQGQQHLKVLQVRKGICFYKLLKINFMPELFFFLFEILRICAYIGQLSIGQLESVRSSSTSGRALQTIHRHTLE